MVELPAHLIVGGVCPVWIRKTGGFDGVGGGTQRVGTHMANGDSLTGSSGSGCCSGVLHLTRTDATSEPTANPLGSPELSPGERGVWAMRSSRAVIIWSCSLKQP